MATDIVLASELGGEFLIGTETPNKITIAVDGTSVTKDAAGVLGAEAPVWDNVSKTITFPAVRGGAAQVIDLSQFTTDIYVNGGSYDAATATLTLSDNDGVTPNVTIDLSTLLGVSTDGGNLLTNGADGKPVFNKAALDAQTAICTSVFGTQLFRGITV